MLNCISAILGKTDSYPGKWGEWNGIEKNENCKSTKGYLNAMRIKFQENKTFFIQISHICMNKQIQIYMYTEKAPRCK